MKSAPESTLRRASLPMAAAAALLLVSLIPAASAGGARTAGDVAGPSPAAVEAPPGPYRESGATRLPVIFEPNVGQAPPGTAFVAHGRSFVARFVDGGLDIVLPEAGGEAKTGSVGPRIGGAKRPDAVKLSMRFEGSRRGAQVVGRDLLEGKTNYLGGPDESTWLRNIPTYRGVRIVGLYDGIDAEFYDRGGDLEYDLIVSPGADLSAIGIRFDGAGRTELDENGDVLLRSAGRVVRHTRAQCYQVGTGTDRVRVAARTQLSPNGKVGFAVGDFDRSSPLVIDPVLEFSAFLGGGSGQDYGNGVAIDSAGAIYVAGSTAATNFPATPGAFDTSPPTQGQDAFIVKLDATGSSVLYATFIGGSDYDLPLSIACDATGAAVVTGYTQSADFPTTSGAVDETFDGDIDVFLLRLSPSGSTLQYSTFLGGGSTELGIAVRVDTGGVATVAGVTSSPDFPTTPGAFDTELGSSDAFLTRVSADGSTLVYSTFIGTGTFATDVDVDGTGAAYVTGRTGAGFPTTPGAFSETYSGSSDAFLAKLSPDGASLDFGTYLGGTGSEGETRVRRASNGDVLVAGYTYSTDFPTTAGAFDEGANGEADMFVARLHGDGAALVYSTYVGGAAADFLGGLTIDAAGSAYAAGRTTSPDFPTTPGVYDPTVSASGNAVVVKLLPDGTGLGFSTAVPGTEAAGIAVDAGGAAIVVGYADTAVGPWTPVGSFDPRDSSAFVLKLSPDATALAFAHLLGGDQGQGAVDLARAHALDGAGNIYLVGSGAGTFPTTPGAFEERGGGGFVAKLNPSGTALVYATFLASSVPAAVVVDAVGAAFVGGRAFDGFPTTAGAFDTSFSGEVDGFVAKLSPDGSALLYSTFVGGSGGDEVSALAVGDDGTVTFGGITSSLDFPTTPGAFDPTFNGVYSDGVVGRLSPSGAGLQWSTYLGGSDFEYAIRAVKLDVLNRPTVLGQTRSANFPATAGAYDPTYNGTGVNFDYGDVFVTRMAADGSALDYSTFLGGGDGEIAGDLALDALGNVYVVGTTFSVDFPVTSGAADTLFVRGEATLTKLSANGATLVYSTFIGGGQYETAEAVDVDDDGRAFVAGWTYSLNFPTTPGALRQQLTDSQDGFVTKMSPTGGSFEYSTLLGGDGPDTVYDLAVDPSGAVVVSGETFSSDFAVTGFGYNDSGNAFVARLRPIPAGVDLSISKSHTGPFRVSSNESYTIAVTNEGSDATVSTVTVTDVLPAGLSFVSGSGAGWSIGAAGQTVTATRATSIASGASSSFSLVVTPSAAAIPGVTNTAVVSVPGDVNLGNNSSSDPTTVTRGVADLGITSVESADPVVTGTLLGYTITVANAGPDPALDVVVTDPLGAGSVFASASVTQGSFTAPAIGQAGVVTATFGTIPAGQQATLSLSVTVTANGGSVVSNTATVSTSSSDPSQLNNFATVSTGVVGTSLAGSDTVGVTVSSTGAWFLRNSNSPGSADLVFGFGPPAVSWVALEGDWNGDGIDTPGLYDPATGAFFLRNASSPGPADLVFTFGPGAAGWAPVVGDWDGSGNDTIGLYVPDSGAFFLKNANSAGPADLVFTFGPANAGAHPLSGDWDGDGDDTIGLYIASTATFFLKNSNAPGAADSAFTYGGPGLFPVTGDWDNNGTDTVGLYLAASGTWFLRNSNTPGPADLAFGYGPANATPLSGDWDDQ